MWKVVLIVLLLVAAGHFAVRYLRTNPLDPKLEGSEVVVETNEYEVRFARQGTAEGVYLIVGARSEDFTNRPQNASITAIDFATARAYLEAYPEFRLYGSPSGLQLENVAAPIGIVAANRIAYGDLIHALDLFEERASQGGERICVGLSGEELVVASAVALSDGRDHSQMFRSPDAVQRTLLADRVRIDDCSKLVGAAR